ncbi:hypothetical protein AVEN_170183-1 [Araneus ventricosus]|uniref:Uncharacterized protein n=1 Tax=Araneus ventricosus TaxID=182803 RepID=A0A4Y2TRM6_ARAVE|nr:hypothetical protein AVEN_170183-1 [Araneus ventricosus]
MVALKAQRKSLRTVFTVAAKNVKQHLEVLEADGKDLGKLSSLHSQLDDKFSRLEVVQKEITSLLLEHTSTHSEFEADFEAAESYRDNYLDFKTKVEASLKSSRGLIQCSSMDNAPKLKLPNFELKKFSGDPKEFITFWSIFSKIHEPDDLTEVDKFQYLYQCMVPESRAARLISSFPITTENYSKAIQQLKARFGRYLRSEDSYYPSFTTVLLLTTALKLWTVLRYVATLSVRQERSYDWAERTLTRTDLCLDEPFWTRIKTVADVRNYHWDRHIGVLRLVWCCLPRINTFVDSKRESYGLLCLLLELRTEYEKFPERRDYIKDVAKKCTEMFLCQLQERKNLDRYTRNALRGILGISSVMIGSWMFSVNTLTMCVILWVGKKILY